MAYELIEVSNDQGQPIFLYEFQLQSTVWAYTGAATDKIIGGRRYTQCAISDDGIKQSGDASADVLNITAPSTIGPAQLYVGTPPASPVYVRIRHMHEGDTEAPLVYVGEVTQADLATPGTARISALPLAASMEREGLRLGWQRTCPYSVYDSSCKVKKEDHALHATITQVENGLVTAPEFASVPSGRLNGGFLEWSHPIRGVEMRTIEEHIGDSIRMFGLSDGLYYGLKVIAYPGCDLMASTCHDVFNNLGNNGSVPHMPGKSPFDGTPVF